MLIADWLSNNRDIYNLARTSRMHWLYLTRRFAQHLEVTLIGNIIRDNRVFWNQQAVQSIRSLLLFARVTGPHKRIDRYFETFVARYYSIKHLAPLEALHLNIEHNLFSGYILNRVDPSVLKTLELPFPNRPTHFQLGNLLSRLKSLNSLKIANIPTGRKVSKAFPLIGEGLMACSRTLRHLDLTVVNSSWETDRTRLPFVFSWYNGRDPFAAIFEKFLFRASENVPLLRVESLRLKRFSIPSVALELVFDGRCIQHLSLPSCRVDTTTWTKLGDCCQLLSLTNVNYELVGQRLLDFTHLQNSLKELTFAIPDPTYKKRRDLDDEPVYYITRRIPSLGPATQWYKRTYPDSSLTKTIPEVDKFEAALEGKVHMKYPQIPPSMYDINK
ncbi:MAG: hypothetical protein LQ351_006177 [Letrouitia transgressa]|nr:MAG: hypothetical protein LQ351_006177 [Letrouitia transgressa]